ncbi:hypothetical protein [Burkholderia multivorans]|uniref:hypothetical protein n=1 Tax=Burkholderia multivorans TaxID=87883 RepID=UPI0021C00AFE|nr:hypothetical protein [Burkholderia multivorans]
MDKYEQRWRALVRLKDQLGRGGAAHIAREIGKEPNYISRALYPPGKNGRKRIGEETAELLSEKFPGWLSEEGWKGAGSSSTSAPPVVSQMESPRGWNRLRDDQRAAIEHLIDVMLTRTPSSDVTPPTDGFAGD